MFTIEMSVSRTEGMGISVFSCVIYCNRYVCFIM